MKFLLMMIIVALLVPSSVLAEKNIVEIKGRLIRLVDGKEHAVTSGIVKVGFYDADGELKLHYSLEPGIGVTTVPGQAEVSKDGSFNVRINKDLLKKIRKMPLNIGIAYFVHQSHIYSEGALLETKSGIKISFELTDSIKEIDTEKLFGKIDVK